MEEELIKEVEDYLNSMERKDISKNYDEIASIFIKYKEKGLSKEQALKSIGIIAGNNNEFDEYQDEVLTDIENRITGFCTPSLKIEW